MNKWKILTIFMPTVYFASMLFITDYLVKKNIPIVSDGSTIFFLGWISCAFASLSLYMWKIKPLLIKKQKHE
jgi:hypothetical protein